MTKKISLILAAMLFVGTAQARITGTQPTNPDIVCFGPDGTEVCVDSSGNIVNTTDNDGALGSSSLRFSAVNAYDLAASDDVTVADDATVTGDLFKVMAATVTVTDGVGIVLPDGACGGILRLTATTDVQSSDSGTITAASASNAGCALILVNSGGSGVITLDDNSGFDTGVGYPHAGAIELGTSDVVMIMSLGTRWATVGTVADN